MNQLSETIGALEWHDLSRSVDDGTLETSVSGPRPTSPRYDCTRIDGALETASLHAAAGPTQSLKRAGGQRC